MTGVAQLAGMNNKNSAIPFFIQGTNSNPQFVPGVKGVLSNQFKSAGQNPAGNLMQGLSGILGKKK